jgi:hypothetical protein
MKGYGWQGRPTTPCILLHPQVDIIPSFLLRTRSTISERMPMITLNLCHVNLMTVTEDKTEANAVSVLRLTRHSARRNAPDIPLLHVIATTQSGDGGKSAGRRCIVQALVCRSIHNKAMAVGTPRAPQTKLSTCASREMGDVYT